MVWGCGADFAQGDWESQKGKMVHQPKGEIEL